MGFLTVATTARDIDPSRWLAFRTWASSINEILNTPTERHFKATLIRSPQFSKALIEHAEMWLTPDPTFYWPINLRELQQFSVAIFRTKFSTENCMCSQLTGSYFPTNIDGAHRYVVYKVGTNNNKKRSTKYSPQFRA